MCLVSIYVNYYVCVSVSLSLSLCLCVRVCLCLCVTLSTALETTGEFLLSGPVLECISRLMSACSVL